LKLPLNLGLKDAAAVATRLFAVTVMGANTAPVGTVTTIEFVEAEFTVARTPPKKTMLLLATGLKLVPVIVTVEPIPPDVGLNDIIAGTSAA
jgi:hypothetical protein